MSPFTKFPTNKSVRFWLLSLLGCICSFMIWAQRSKMLWKNLKKVVAALHKKWSFPIRVSSVNVTKSAVCDRYICVKRMPQHYSEAVFRRSSEKKMFLKVLYNSQENNCTAVFQPVNLLKQRLWCMCFLVNLAKFLRTPIFQNICERLLLLITYGKILLPLNLREQLIAILQQTSAWWFLRLFLKHGINHFFPFIFIS